MDRKLQSIAFQFEGEDVTAQKVLDELDGFDGLPEYKAEALHKALEAALIGTEGQLKRILLKLDASKRPPFKVDFLGYVHSIEDEMRRCREAMEATSLVCKQYYMKDFETLRSKELHEGFSTGFLNMENIQINRFFKSVGSRFRLISSHFKRNNPEIADLIQIPEKNGVLIQIGRSNWVALSTVDELKKVLGRKKAPSSLHLSK